MQSSFNTPANITNYSMPGLAFLATPLGVIRLGHIEEHVERAFAVADDEFRITRPVKDSDGWVPDPLDEQLRPAATEAERKLRAIPVHVQVNDPALVIRSRFEAFNVRTNRPVCASCDSGKARRLVDGEMIDVDCAGPDRCEFASDDEVRCKFFGRVNLQIEGQESALGTYVLRSSSVHTLRTLESKLWQYWALFGKRLRGAKFKIVMKQASSALSQWAPFYFVDLELVDADLAAAMSAVKGQAERDDAAGLDVPSLEAAMHEGLRNGGFLASDESFEAVEFFSDAGRPASRGVVMQERRGELLQRDEGAVSLGAGPVVIAGFRPGGGALKHSLPSAA